MLKRQVEEIIQGFSGQIGVYYKNLVTGESFGINAERPFVAASVIKIPVMVEAYRQVALGQISLDTLVEVRESDKVPSCGVLRMMHRGLQVTVQDLCNLMIVISDNTATNVLINVLGRESVNATMRSLGLSETQLNRLLFDVKAREQGIQNYFAPAEIGVLLERMFAGTLVSAEASKAVIEVLLNQQLNHKIPYFIPDDVEIAHKTGEDDGTTHDVGIVFAREPFVLCLAANGTDVVETEMGFRRVAQICYEFNQ